jgi:RHS repeat-associated protein
MSGLLVLTLVLSTLAVIAASARREAQAAVPPGGLVDSVSGFGVTEGSFSVTDDGAGAYSLPLWTPDARGDVKPGLSLNYHSRAGNGLLGVGWSLSGLPRITPCQRTLAQDGEIRQFSYTSSDAYCLDGSRLMPVGDATGAEREYRTENDMFARIKSFGPTGDVPDYFRAWAQDGRIMTFGQQTATNNGRIRPYQLRPPTPRDPRLERSSARVTAAWLLTSVEDRNGNRADYAYRLNEGGAADLWYVESLPLSITYSPDRQVRFVYPETPRSDPVDAYSVGVHTRTTRLLSAVQMFDGSTMLREYRLGYVSNSSTFRSRLSGLSECDGRGACKRHLAFDWSLGTYEFDEINTGITDVGTSDVNGRLVVPGDVDGDGRDDLVYPIGDNTWWIRRGNATGTFTGRTTANIPGVNPLTNRPGVKPIDVDRDGRLDLMVQVPQSETEPLFLYDMYRSNGTSFSKHPQDVDPEDNGQTFGLSTPFFLDLDGNGTPDFATPRASHPDASQRPWHYRLNGGTVGSNQFGTMHRETVTQGLGTQWGLVDAVDVRGDGRTSLLRIVPAPEGGYVFQTVSLNPAVVSDLDVRDINLFAGNPRMFDRQFADVNGDGLSDAVYPFMGLAVQLNSGNGFGPVINGPAQYVNPIIPPNGDFTPGVRIADFNNDGAEDVMILHPGPPSGFEDFARGVQIYTWQNNRFERRPVLESAGSPSYWGYAPAQPLDSNGDGLLDLVLPRPGVPGELQVLRRQYKDGIPDLLTGVSIDGVGSRVQVEYSTLGDRATHTPDSCTYPRMCLTRGSTVVRRHALTTGMAPPLAWHGFLHSYRGARADLRGRGWLGVAQHTVTDEITSGTVTTAFDNNTRDTDGPTEVYPGAFVPDLTTFTQFDRPGGTQYQQTVDHENVLRRLTVPGTFTVERRFATETERERPPGGAWQVLRTSTTRQEYDRFGNVDVVTSRTESGRVYQEERGFRNDEAAWLIGLITLRDTEGCTAAGICVNRRTRLDYDGAGNLTEVVVEPDKPQLTLTTVIRPGQFGVVDSTTQRDAAGQERTTRYEYDDRRLTLDAIVNPLEHRTTMQFDGGLGVPTSVTDPNGVQATMRYDRFGRLREINHADGSFARTAHMVVDGDHIFETTSSGGGGTRLTLDRLGRESAQSVRSFDGGWSTVTTRYDRLGRVALVSQPFLAGQTVHNSSFEYDNHGRLTAQVDPDAVRVTRSYSGLRTDTVDGRGIRSFTLATVDGEVASRAEDDPNSTTWLTTSFSYDGFGLPKTMTAADGTVQSMDYDVLGRRTKLVDPSAGTTSTLYNAFGDVVSETNGTNETVEYRPDALGRVKTTIAPGGTATNTWDTAPNGIGKLATARSTDGTGTVYRYNQHGLPTTTTWNIDGTQYEIARTYDAVGRPESLTYPAIPGINDTQRFKVNYVYNPSGYRSEVRNAATGGAIYSLKRNGAGQVTEERHANGVVSVNQYRPETGLLDRITTTGPGTVGTLVDIGYDYDNNRNVIERGDDHNGRQEVYEYDELNRIKRWYTRVAAPGQVAINATYGYDTVGNLKRETFRRGTEPLQEVVYGHGEDGAPPHALTSRNSAHYGYDAAGRQTTGPQRTISYNHFDLPTVHDWGQGMRTEYRYDADGERVLKRDAGQTVIYVPGLFERRTPVETGGTEIHNLHNIVVDGEVVAQVNRVQSSATSPVVDTRLNPVHTDGQGSTVKVTNAAGRPVGGPGEILGELYYDPFGRRVDARYEPRGHQRHGGPRQGYTAHEHQDENGLINMKGRMYDPEARRFLTPDPVGQDPLSSQAHNRYSYVRNNPTTLIDPSGLQSDDETYIEISKSIPSSGGSTTVVDTSRVTGGGTVNTSAMVPMQPSVGAPVQDAVGTSSDDGNGTNPGWVTSTSVFSSGGGELTVTTGDGYVAEVYQGNYFWQENGQYWRSYEDQLYPTYFAAWEGGRQQSRANERYTPEQAAAAYSITALETPLGVVTAAACLAWAPCRSAYGDEAAGYIWHTFGLPDLIDLSDLAEPGEGEAYFTPPKMPGPNLKLSIRRGMWGEARVPGQKNTTQIPSLTGTAAYRIPDRLNKAKGEIGEIKNVIYQHLSNQLKDDLAYAAANKFKFILYIRPEGRFLPGTRLSKAVQELVDQKKIIIRYIGE